MKHKLKYHQNVIIRSLAHGEHFLKFQENLFVTTGILLTLTQPSTTKAEFQIAWPVMPWHSTPCSSLVLHCRLYRSDSDKYISWFGRPWHLNRQGILSYENKHMLAFSFWNINGIWKMLINTYLDMFFLVSWQYHWDQNNNISLLGSWWLPPLLCGIKVNSDEDKCGTLTKLNLSCFADFHYS